VSRLTRAYYYIALTCCLLSLAGSVFLSFEDDGIAIVLLIIVELGLTISLLTFFLGKKS